MNSCTPLHVVRIRTMNSSRFYEPDVSDSVEFPEVYLYNRIIVTVDESCTIAECGPPPE